jgi:hypothetical protein
MRKNDIIRTILAGIAVLGLITFLAGCGGGGDSGGGAGATGTITLEADVTSIPADGASSATIKATVKDSTGQPVRNFTDVTFTTTLGQFRNGGTSYTVQTQPSDPANPKSDPTGIAQVALIAGTTPGTAKVTVSSNNVTQSIKITLTHSGNQGVPVAEEFSLSAEYVNISGLWVASLEDVITASVGDIYGNAVKDDTIIYFKTYNTGGYFGQDQVPTAEGKASSSLYTSGSPAPAEGFAMLTAETTGDDTTRVTSITAAPYPDHHIMYAGTNGGGVYKSTDYGVNWETVSRSTQNPKRGQNLIDPYIKGHSCIAIDPDNHNAVYVGTGYLGKGNVYRSLDGGMNWNSNNVEEWNGLFETTAAVLTVACDGDDVSSTDYPYVWIGTEGKGPLYATDGKTFQPSGSYASTPVPGSGNTGNGTMSDPVVSYSSVSETWTATCIQTPGTATTPSFSGTGDGTISAITTSTTTKTEDWTVQYLTTAGAVTPGSSNVGDGSVVDIEITNPNGPSETWTLTCSAVTVAYGDVTGSAAVKGSVTGISVTGGPTEETFTLTCTKAGTNDAEFNVASDTRGSFGTAPSNGSPWTSSSGEVTLTITHDSSQDFQLEEIFTFTVTNTTTFKVHSSIAGYYPDAMVGEPYSNNALSFQINQGSIAFAKDDTLTFTATTAWKVVGSVSGEQSQMATTGTAYTSDNGEIAFTITEGATAFVHGDKFTFATTAGTTYWRVSGSVSGTQTNVAFNDTGYYSDKREIYFVISEGSIPFADGDTFTFTVTASKLGHGWTVWEIVQVPGTHGASAVLYAGTATGVYKSSNGARTWDSTTYFTGDYAIALALYPTATGGARDIIYAGTQNGGVWVSTDSGSSWTQYVTGIDSGKGATVKDLLVDPSYNKLYAIVYEGPETSATGDVYVHSLNSDGTMASGGWSKANTGLSGSALYALAADIPSTPTSLFVGGEGISLSAARSGLDTGNPSWADSKNGLSNLIMARMPLLFSGECALDVSQYRNGDTVNFTVYLQDVNGNPPISGTTFKVTYTPETGDEVAIYDLTYGDSYTAQGTFRDPSNPATNLPYSFSVTVSGGDQVVIEYTPENTLPEVPGSSGSAVTRTYNY